MQIVSSDIKRKKIASDSHIEQFHDFHLLFLQSRAQSAIHSVLTFIGCKQECV